MTTSSVYHTAIKKMESGTVLEKEDLLAVEEPLEIRLGYGKAGNREQRKISVTMRTPGNDEELAIGFLFTEGIIASASDIVHVRHCKDEGKDGERGNVIRVELNENVAFDLAHLTRNFYTSSSCGVCGKASIDAIKTNCNELPGTEPVIDHRVIHRLPEVLREKQLVFKHTGGLHAVALFDKNGELMAVREDVGRHNAMDKLIGSVLLKGIVPLSDGIVLLSGRASFELVQKALMAGVPVLAAVGAPSSLAVAVAKDFRMTLMGFVNDQKFNIYSGDFRLKLSQ